MTEQEFFVYVLKGNVFPNAGPSEDNYTLLQLLIKYEYLEKEDKVYKILKNFYLKDIRNGGYDSLFTIRENTVALNPNFWRWPGWENEIEKDRIDFKRLQI